MWATCPHSATSSYCVEFHEGYHQKHTNLLNFGTSSLDISCYHAFTKDTALSENGIGTGFHQRAFAGLLHKLKKC
jgi:ribosomal protein L11 methylase PrmA